MHIEQVLSNKTRLTDLNALIAKHTNFENFDDLVSEEHNFRLTMYIEDDMNNLQKLELREIAGYYDEWMIMHDDPRRIYTIG